MKKDWFGKKRKQDYIINMFTKTSMVAQKKYMSVRTVLDVHTDPNVAKELLVIEP